MIYVSEGFQREGNPPLFGQQSCEKQFLGVKVVIVKVVVDCTRVFDDLEVLPALDKHKQQEKLTHSERKKWPL
jgi:hypothetical protein